MRLRDIQHILREEFSGLVVTAEGPLGTPAGNAKRFPRRRLEAALRGLRHVHPLRGAAEKALAHKALKEMGEPTTVIDKTFDDFMQNHVQPLNRRGVDLLALLDDILPKENPLAFAYEFPDTERTIDGFLSDVKELNLLFDEPLARLAGSRTLVTALVFDPAGAAVRP